MLLISLSLSCGRGVAMPRRATDRQMHRPERKFSQIMIVKFSGSRRWASSPLVIWSHQAYKSSCLLRVRVSVLEAHVCCCATDDLFQGRSTLSKVAEILGSLTSRGDFLAFTSVLQELHGNASLCACCAPLPTGAFDIIELM